MRDLEREREKQTVHGKTLWLNFHGGGYILMIQSIFFSEN